jgi:hypothetical protein
LLKPHGAAKKSRVGAISSNQAGRRLVRAGRFSGKQIIPGALRVVFLGIALGLPGFPIFSRAEISAPQRPPAQAVPLVVKVKPGDSVDVPLRAAGADRESIKFKIRQGPRAGELGDIKMTGIDRGVIVYRHGGGEASRDVFTYAVQSAAGVSAAAEVQIVVEDDPALLVAPDKIVLPDIQFGGTGKATVAVENGGGGTAIITPQIDPPWRVLGEGTLRVPAGGTQQFEVELPGTEVGSRTASVIYPGFPGKSTLLTATVQPPFVVEKERVRFVPEGADRAVAEIELRNDQDRAVEIITAPEEGLTVAQKIEVPAKSSSTLRVEAPADIGKWSKVTLQSGDYRREIAVEPIPPVVIPSIPTPAASVPPTVPPIAAATPRRVVPVPRATPASAVPQPVASAVVNEEPEPVPEPIYGPPHTKVDVSNITRTSAVLTWQDSGDWKYAFEKRQLSLDGNGALVIQWTPWQSANVTREGKTVRVALSGLPAGEGQTFRILPSGGTGEQPVFGIPVSFKTLPPIRLFTPVRLLLILLVVLVVVIIRQRWRAHQRARE